MIQETSKMKLKQRFIYFMTIYKINNIHFIKWNINV
jgi:hypothetical protein